MSGNAEVDEKVSFVALIGLLAAFCAFISERAQSQHAPSNLITTCADVSVNVAAASLEEQYLACSAAGNALQSLGRCEITLKQPLYIEISKVVRNPFGTPIFGRFDTKQEVVFLTQFAGISHLINDTPYNGIPKVDFYKSLIVHEVIHGVMHQNYKRQPTSRAANEYAAYALQIASLPADSRDKFLQVVNETSGKGNILFNDIVLAFDPYFFAARAYEHFSATPRRFRGDAEERAEPIGCLCWRGESRGKVGRQDQGTGIFREDRHDRR